MNIFDNSPRRKRSHCHRQYTSPKLHDVSINGPLPYVQIPLGMNNIRTKLHPLPLSKLHSLYATCLKTSTSDPYSTLYKLAAIMLDIGQHRLFKPVTIRGNEMENIPFFPLVFANIGLAAINLGNILHHKSIKAMVPPYLHPTSLIINVYCRTSALMTSKPNS